MHGATFLQDLAVVMMVAGLVTLIFHRLKQPVVLGYIIAGVIIGPHTPPFPLIKDEQTIKTLSELGVVLLMFSLGLQFSFRKLSQVGRAAFIAAFLEILLMMWVGYQIGRMFGWKTMDSLFLGAMLSISSTTIIVKTLMELGMSKQRFAQIVLGILVIEDILAIVIIALLSGIAMTGSLSVPEVAGTLGKLGIFLVAALVAGLLAVPRLLAYVAKFKSNEMLLISVLGLCFGFSLLAVQLGYSVALGAFMIGAIIGEAREVGRIELLTEPVRDMFSAIFFVAIGLLIDPRILAEHAWTVLVITLAVVAGKTVTCAFGAFVGGNDTRTSLQVGLGLAQIGEFSFIIAALGLNLGVTSEFLYPIAVAVSALTSLLTPYLVKSSGYFARWFERAAPDSLLGTLELYTSWVGEREAQKHTDAAGKFTRRWLLQVVLNAALIGAVFLGAAFVSQRPPVWVQELRMQASTVRAALWFGSVMVSMPVFIAIFRKLQAIGMLIAETKVTTALAGERTSAIRAVVAQVIPFAGMTALGLYVLLLSSTLLPPWEVLLVLLAIAALVSWLFWRSLIKIYSKAQIALRETLAEKPAPVPEPPLPLILKEANLESVIVPGHSPAAGKLIRQLELRTRTGASIVAIEHNGATTINPGPDEELGPGDQVLLLGTPAQLAAAKKALTDQPLA